MKVRKYILRQDIVRKNTSTVGSKGPGGARSVEIRPERCRKTEKYAEKGIEKIDWIR